jgi:hypothetical protein
MLALSGPLLLLDEVILLCDSIIVVEANTAVLLEH